MRPDVVEVGRAWLIANGEGYGESFRKLTDGFRAAAEDRAVLIIDALQMFEKLSCIHLAGNAEADAIGERTIGCKKNAAVFGWPRDAPGAQPRKIRNAKPAILKSEKRISGGRVQEILLLAGSGKKKSEAVKSVDGFAFPCGLDGALTGAHCLDRFDEFRENIRIRTGDVVRAQHEFQFR